MGEAADQLPRGFLHPLLLRFPVYAEDLIYREQLQKKPWCLPVAERCYGQVYGQALMLGCRDQLQLAAGIALTPSKGAG